MVDETQSPVWEQTDCFMITWKSRIKKGTLECLIKIPATQIEVINQSLTSYASTKASRCMKGIKSYFYLGIYES